MDKYTPISQVDAALISYEENKADKRVFNEVCDNCGKPFTFMKKDIKDRVIKCPHCGREMIYFSFNYDMPNM